jgi:DMSO/TMAO reductase YedYZ heme-binding membrane subunit
MPRGGERILKSKYFNDWPLFYMIVAANSLAVIGYTFTQDLTVPLGLSEMIQCTVRVSVPLLFVAFAASSMPRLVPGPFRKWLLRNRRYFGLGFAAGFAWQMVFILWLAIGHPEYYAEEVFSGVSDFIIYRLGPYLFLVAMTITSFFPVRKKMNRKAWHALHWTGIYYLWWDVELTYWYEVTFYEDRQIIDYIYVTLGGLAYLARVGEWIRLRVAKLRK